MFRAFPMLLLTLASCVAVHAAASTQPDGFADRVRSFNQVPIPNLQPSFTWLDDTTLLSRLDGPDGTVSFRLTDAVTGRHRAAFDQQALAGSLSDALGREVDAARLPIARVAGDQNRILALVEPDALVFAVLDEGRAVEAVALNDAIPFLLPVGDRRPRGSGPTTVQFVNQVDRPVRVLWQNGSRRVSYGVLSPGTSRKQGTFVGHVWYMVDDQGAEYGPFVAGETTAIALSHPSTRTAMASKGPTAIPSSAPVNQWHASVENHNIVLRHVDNGQSRQITTDGTPDDRYTTGFQWSPDGKRLFAIRTRPSTPREVHIVASSPDDQRQPKLVSFPYRKPGDAIDHHRPVLFEVDPGAGEATPIEVNNELFSTPWSRFESIAWQPDGTRVVFTYVERGHRVARVIEIDSQNGSARVLINEAPETFFDYAHKMYFEPVRSMREAIWMSERSGWNHLHRFDLVTGDHLGAITAGEWVVRGIDRVDHEAEQIWFRAMGVYPDQDPYHIHFGRVGFDGEGLTWLTRGDGTHSVTYSPGRDYLIASYSRVDQAPVHELRRTSDGRLVAELARADTQRLSHAGWRPPEVFAAKGRDGQTDIWGVIYTPTDFAPDKVYPVVEQIYAGPHGQHVPKQFARWRHGPRELAERGFVVVQIDGMGTNWRSKAFHDVAWKNLADAGFPDRIAWLRAAAKTRPWMDLSRVGIFGGSAGGQNAMAALLHHNELYDVAVADCGCHDNRMDKIWWNELWMGWPIDEAAYDASSNVEHAHKLKGELLLIVGELDTNVDPASTMQVVDALIRADKNFDMLVIPGVGHGAGDTPYGRRRTLEFLVEHLITRPPHGEEQ